MRWTVADGMSNRSVPGTRRNTGEEMWEEKQHDNLPVVARVK